MDDECRRYWLYADLYSLCVLYDTWACVFLRRTGPQKKCGKYHDGLWGDHGAVRCYVDIVWIFAGIWRKPWRDYRRPEMVCAEWCWLGAGTLCRYDPASGICSVPDDVCHITPALIIGAVVGRMRFKALFFFVAIWSLIVYYPMAHMVWGDGGFLAAIGSVDFAGGNVVHISSGVSALVLAIYLGQRRGYAKATYRTHNIPFVFLGSAMLWFGWFGFNAGSALKADGLAAHAFMTSSISSACALLTWMLIEVIREGKPTLVGASTGLVIGLVAITPGAGFVPVWASFIIGILVSPICYFTVILLKQKLKIDDALDAFGCHGIGGIWGGIATGLFGKSSINSVAKWDGLVFGDYRLFLAQVLSIVITIAVAIVGTLICIGIVRIFTPLRVDPKEELVGLDASQHGENAYPSFNGFD